MLLLLETGFYYFERLEGYAGHEAANTPCNKIGCRHIESIVNCSIKNYFLYNAFARLCDCAFVDDLSSEEDPPMDWHPRLRI